MNHLPVQPCSWEQLPCCSEPRKKTCTPVLLFTDFFFLIPDPGQTSSNISRIPSDMSSIDVNNGDIRAKHLKVCSH